MNIAMLTDTYFPQVNGVSTSVYLFRKNLEKLGHRIYIVSPVGPKGDPYFFKVKGFRTMQQKDQKIALPDAKHLLQFLEDNQITHIHSHSPLSMGWTALWLQKRYGYVHFHTYHTLLVEYRHYMPRLFRPSRKLTQEFSKWFCSEVDCVIAPTTEMKKELEGYGLKKEIQVIPTGIDTDLFQTAQMVDLRKLYHLPKDAFISLFAGRMAKEKNITFLFEVTERLVRSGAPFYLVLVGNGPYYEELVEIVRKKKLNDRIIFAGEMPRTQLAGYYRSADCFSFASTSETQGLVVLEALAAGLPVIAVAQKGVKNVLKNGEGCFLTDTPDAAFFTEQITQLMKKPELRETASAEAVAYIKKNWSINLFAEKVSELYKKYQKPEQYVPKKMFEFSELWMWLTGKLRSIQDNIFK
jgi:glycosyltransferase involved in cell wall biosynthesis